MADASPTVTPLKAVDAAGTGSPASAQGDGPVKVATVEGNYLAARGTKLEEPWTGRMKVTADQEAIHTIQASPILMKEGTPTLQDMSVKKESRVFEAQPTTQYDNLAGVRLLRADLPPKIEKRTIEFKLLPPITGETRIIKADVMPIQPVGTRGNPAKEMPKRQGFQVSAPVVVKTDPLFVVSGARTVQPNVTTLVAEKEDVPPAVPAE